MAADIPRPRDERFPPADGDPAGEPQAALGDGGETLAEKIHRYRQSGSPPSGDPSGSGDTRPAGSP